MEQAPSQLFQHNTRRPQPYQEAFLLRSPSGKDLLTSQRAVLSILKSYTV